MKLVYKKYNWGYLEKARVTKHNFPDRANITKTCIFKYTENFATKKWKIFRLSSDILNISAQNIDWRYSLEPPQQGVSHEYPQSMFLSINKKNIPL